MSSAISSVWLGYSRQSGKFGITLDEIRRGIAILGHGTNQLAPLVAKASHEAGLKVLVLDMSGTVSTQLSGYIDEYPLPHFLYDSLRIDDNPNIHAQLIACAYATALELSFEQEASLNNLTQNIAAERGIASPMGLADLIGSHDTVKTRTVDKLKIRLESLRSLNMTGDAGAVKELLQKSAILNFKDAGSHEASEVAAAVFIAKLLALLGVEEVGAHRPDLVILTEANRLFKVRPVFRKSQRFLTSFVTAPVAKVLASDSAYGLDEDYLSTCSIKILSSATYNETSKNLLLTPNMFMFQNHPYGYEDAFIPRDFEPKKGESRGVPPAEQEPDLDLMKRMLEEIDVYKDATRASVIAFLSSDFPIDKLEKTFDRLQSDGYVSASPELRSGRKIHVLSLTEKGKAVLQGRGE